MSPVPGNALLSLLTPALPTPATVPPETGAAKGAEAPETGGFSQIFALTQEGAAAAQAPAESPTIAPAVLPVAGKILPAVLPLDLEPEAPPSPAPPVAAPRLPKVLATLLVRQPRKAAAEAEVPETEQKEEPARPAANKAPDQPQAVSLPVMAAKPNEAAPSEPAAKSAVTPAMGPVMQAPAAPQPIAKPSAETPQPALVLPRQDRPAPLPPQAAMVVEAHPQPVAAPPVALRVARKSPAEPAPLDPPALRPEAPAPLVASTPAQPLPVSPVPSVPTERPADFTQIVDRLVAARDLAVAGVPTQPVHVALQHGEFGKVSLRLEADSSGLSVAMASSDPAFAAAVQSAAQVQPPVASSADLGSGNTGQQGPSARTDSGGQPGAQGQPRRADPEPRGPAANPSPARSGEEPAQRRRGLFA